jgi:hypothetical protein
MANNPQSIRYIDLGDGQQHPIDAVTLGDKSASDFQENMLVTSISSSSDDKHYPSAKCMWDIIGDVHSLLQSI